MQAPCLFLRQFYLNQKNSTQTKKRAMPQSKTFRADELEAIVNEWLGEEGHAVFTMHDTMPLAFYHRSTTGATEWADKENFAGPYTASEVRPLLLKVADNGWQKIRSTDSGASLHFEQFEYEFTGGLAGILTKVGLTDRVPVTYGSCSVTAMAHIIRESASEQLEAEIALQILRQDRVLETVSQQVMMDRGRWDTYLFFTPTFRTSPGSCTLRVTRDTDIICEIDVEIVDEGREAPELPPEEGVAASTA